MAAATALGEWAVPAEPVGTAHGETIATLRGVRKQYGATVALDGLDLSIRAGEVLGLLGPNGAGKTTAVRLLLGLTSADKGEVRVLGRDPRAAAARTRTGAMLQVASVPGTLKVREHINLFRSYYPAPLPLGEAMDVAGVAGIADRLFATLSGGQKQRVLFAMAICGNPDLLFLDEPSVGMDIEARRSLWAAVEHLAERGKSVLLTTHYLEEADALSHRVAVLSRGRVMVQGTPAEVKSLVQGRTVKCVTAVPEETLRRLPGVSAVTRERETWTLRTRQAEDCVRALLQMDSGLSGLEVASAGLEDAFLALTGTEGSS